MKSTARKKPKSAPAKKRSPAAGKRSSRRATATIAVNPSAPASSSAISTAAPTTSASGKSGKGKGGRPKRTKELATQVCALIAAGESLRAIGRRPDMPSADFFREWLAADADFAAQYARAREEQADHYADEIVEMADAAIGKDAAEVQARRLAVDARKWVASKLKPKKYGEKVTQEHTGPGGGAVKIELEWV